MYLDENKIDWNQLRHQKDGLIAIREDIIEQFRNDMLDARRTDLFGKSLSGIIHFLDYVQDSVVEQGLKTEQEVFAFKEE